MAWAAAQAYVAMLQMPGAVAYGAFHTALMGKALTCLGQWCRTSPVHAPGTGKDSSAAASRYVAVDMRYIYNAVLMRCVHSAVRIVGDVAAQYRCYCILSR
jgi:hypothetical protein